MKYFVAIVIACVLAAFTTASRAESQDYVIFHGASKHVSPEYKLYQERNLGAAYRFQKSSELGYQFGIYLNSHNKLTAYAAIQETPLKIGRLDAGWFYGVGTGYKTPLSAGFMLNYHQGKAVYTVRHVPRIAANVASVTTFEMGFRF